MRDRGGHILLLAKSLRILKAKSRAKTARKSRPRNCHGARRLARLVGHLPCAPTIRKVAANNTQQSARTIVGVTAWPAANVPPYIISFYSIILRDFMPPWPNGQGARLRIVGHVHRSYREIGGSSPPGGMSL